MDRADVCVLATFAEVAARMAIFRMPPSLFAAFSVLVLSAGCVERGDVQPADVHRGDAHAALSGIVLAERSGQPVVISVVRSAGPSPRRLDEEDIRVVSRFGGEPVGIAVIVTEDIADETLESLRSDYFASFAAHAAATLSAWHREHSALGVSRFRYYLLVWSRDDPVYLRMDAPLDGSALQIVVAGSSGQGVVEPLGWWASAVETIAHELAHLSHQQNDRDALPRTVDAEAAAEVLGTCARIRYHDSIGTRNVTLDFERAEDELAFPAIADGRFAPRMERLNHLPSATARGDALGMAVLLTFFRNREVRFSDREELNAFYDYCKRLAGSQVPEFTKGKLE